VKVGLGDHVEAGCANLGGSIDLLVKATGRETRVGRLTQLIEDASSARPPIVQWADSIGGWFVTVVIVLASATMVIWFPRDPYTAAENAVALLIVACPCALALATPLALAVAIGRAASHGLLVRGGDVLERLSQRGIVWFDKTGTLTEGRVTLVDWDGDDESLALAAALERSSAHPFAQAVCRAAEERGLAIATAADARQTSGLGMEGTVGVVQVLVGNRRFLEQRGIAVSSAVDATLRRITASGLSPLLIALDGHVRAIASLGDSLRADASLTVARLRQAGWRVGILSGDHPSAVQHVADRLGVDDSLARGGHDPEAKLQTIHESKRGGRIVVMVGDGVNDAAALAAADVGVAAAGGASASLDAAPVYLQDGRLSGLVELIGASSRTVRLIRRNFALSLAYNVGAVMLAMLGWINPLIAAVLMPLSSLTVLGSVLASRTFDQEAEDRVDSARAFPPFQTSPATALGAEA
jgi:Cu2+-exporting ATPase